MDNETQLGGGGTQNQERGRAGMAMGSLVLAIVGNNLLMKRGGGDCDLGGGGNGNGKGSGTNKKLADCQRAAERDKRGSRQCQGEGGRFPCKAHGNLDRGGHAGARMPAFDFFFVENIIQC